ncbi:MAG TPA: hypothetical protein VGQ86_01580 [Candidatus Limnocylindria bacterium]|nr:hypothetical protein [Candidatus Limnocylindria bacterium]
MPIWYGLSWAELKRETGDERMSPLAHALSVFVPGYALWQAHRHFTLLDGLLRKIDPLRGVDAVTGAIGTGIWWLTWTHYSSEPVFIALDAIELAAGAAVIVYGQRALNTYWRTRPGPVVEERLGEIDWLALGVAATYAVLTVIGYLGTPAQ